MSGACQSKAENPLSDSNKLNVFGDISLPLLTGWSIHFERDLRNSTSKMERFLGRVR